MSKPTIQVTIVDSAGVQQTFRAGHVDLDCGNSGSIDIRPGKPAFCRDFESGVLTLDDGDSVTTLNVVHGMASLSGDTVNVVCEKATARPPEAPLSPPAIPLPVQMPAATENKQ